MSLVSKSIPLQITLGVLFITVQVSWILYYFGKFDYFIQPHKCSHSTSMIYIFLPLLGYQACTNSLIMYVAIIDSNYVGYFIILRSYVCRILDLYQVLTYGYGLYWFLMSTFFSILNSYVYRIRHIFPKWNTLFEKGLPKFNYFIQPHEYSRILSAHNLIMRIIKIFKIGISCLGVSCGCSGCGCGCEVGVWV